MNPFSTSMLSKATCLILLLSLLATTRSHAQQNIPDQNSEIIIVSGGNNFLRWHAYAGRTYFIQYSDPNDPLGKWQWAPMIERANNIEISHEVGATSGKAFFRLKYTDLPIPSGKTIDTADFDQDGISNIDEVEPPLPLLGSDATDPLDPDTDHDGLPDGYERSHDLDPNDDGSADPDNGPNGDPDGDGLTNAQELAFGTAPNIADSDSDGLNDGEEITLTTDPNNQNTDGDSLDGIPLLDGEDADPKEILVNWKRTPESSYILIDVEAPAEAGDIGNAHDLNDKAEVLFDNGIWAGGEWIPKTPPAITGIIPDTVSPAFPDGIPYEIEFSDWSYFNSDRKLLQLAELHPTDGPGVDSQTRCPIFWPSGQSSASLIFETADRWTPYMWTASALGVSTAGDMVVRVMPQAPPGSSVPQTERIERYDPAGASAGTMDGADDYHPNGGYGHGQMTSSGWVVSNLAREATQNQPAAYKIGLWNAANASIALPAEAAGWGYPVTATDLPNSKVGVIAGQSSAGRVFLPDTAGDYQYSTRLSAQNLKLFAGDGTAMTDTHEVETNGQTIPKLELWRNGKLIPLRDLCPQIGELLDQGYSLSPLKANKHGMYLIQADKAGQNSITALLAKVEFKLRNSQDFDKGWDNTGRDEKGRVVPWTSCGVDRKKPHLGANGHPDGTLEPYPNSIIGLAIPGCTGPLGSFLELVPAPGSETYLSLTNQTIAGETTLFDIQGSAATPTASGCQIIVWQKSAHANRSQPLNVHVFAQRVVEFQMYLASKAPVSPQTLYPSALGAVSDQDIVKAELNTTYNEQANILFNSINNVATVKDDIDGIFNATNGNVMQGQRDSLAQKIPAANHLRIIVIRNIVPNSGIDDICGVAPIPGNYAIVEASAPTLVYSHEAGHALNLTIKSGSDQTNHEDNGVKAPNGGIPLMAHKNQNTHWIRQQDWWAANLRAANSSYRH